jgi:hypothetical protein
MLLTKVLIGGLSWLTEVDSTCSSLLERSTSYASFVRISFPVLSYGCVNCLLFREKSVRCTSLETLCSGRQLDNNWVVHL